MLKQSPPSRQRSYGPWPERSASAAAEFQPQTLASPHDPPQDFITLEFEEFVWPTHVSIFETYCPGAVCAVWALNMFQWQLLWHLDSDESATDAGANGAQPPPQRSRIFSPPLAACATPTRCIRLEFRHRHLDYYAEFDAVLLGGRRVSDVVALQRQVAQRQLGWIERQLDRVRFRPQAAGSDVMDAFFASRDWQRFEDESAERRLAAHSPVQRLPHELLLQIAGFLDLVSLCRLAQTCRQLRAVAYDPHLYRAVNLRPYWALAPGRCGLLDSLQQRCSLLRQLDVSWSCAADSGLQPADIVGFVTAAAGDTLRELRMNCCAALGAADLRAILDGCAGSGEWLTELSLRNFREGGQVRAADVAGLQRLERLDLYHTGFATDVLVAVLARNPRLRHLNVAHGGPQTQMDAVAAQLAATNRGLVSLDMWKSYGLSAAGLAALGELGGELQELDIGWW